MIGFVGADAGGGNVSSITDLTWPAVAAGDVALLFWLMINTAAPTNPTGFALDQSVDDTASTRMRFQHKVCDGTESGALTLTSDTINRTSAVLAVYRGCHATSPIDTWAVRDEGSSATAHACPAVATGFGGCAIVSAAGERSGTGTNDWTPPALYSERADSTSLAVGAGGTIVAVADDGLATLRPAGTLVTPPDWTSGNGVSSANVFTWTVSLRPLASAPPPHPLRQRAHLLVR